MSNKKTSEQLIKEAIDITNSLLKKDYKSGEIVFIGLIIQWGIQIEAMKIELERIIDSKMREVKIVKE